MRTCMDDKGCASLSGVGCIYIRNVGKLLPRSTSCNLAEIRPYMPHRPSETSCYGNRAGERRTGAFLQGMQGFVSELFSASSCKTTGIGSYRHMNRAGFC